MKEDTIGRVSALACLIGDESSAALAGELVEQLPRNELNLLVVGQFKRGKSSLVNAILGADVMPTGALPVTGVVTAVRYGDQPSIEVRTRHDARALKISVEELAGYVSEAYNPSNRLGVQRVDVTWPSERLRGLVLFDTPGIGSTYQHNTEAAQAALPRADAAILLVGPEPPIGADELQYARDVIASSERLFVVLNKCDIAGDSLREVLDFTQAELAKILSDGTRVEVVALSATRAREAQRASREDPGFGAFVGALRDFVEREGSPTRERSVRRRALAIAHRLELLLTMRMQALLLPQIERERRRALVERTLQSVDDRVRALDLMVDDDVRLLRHSLEEEIDRSYDRDEKDFRASGSALARERSTDRRSALLQTIVAQKAGAWRWQAIVHAERDLRACAAKYGRLLGEIETSALEAGCSALHLDPGELVPREIAFAPAQLDLVASVEPKTGLELLVTFATGLLPVTLREPVLRRRYDHVLAGELDALRGRLRYGIARDLEPWQRCVRTTIASSIENTRELVLQVFGELSSPGGRPNLELDQVRGLRRELEVLRLELGSERRGALA